MDNNPYNEQLSWFPPTEQYTYDPASGQLRYHYPLNSQQGKVGTTLEGDAMRQKERYTPTRMSKEHAIFLANKLKQFSLVGSIALFGLFSGLIATHLSNTTSQAAPPPPPQFGPSNPAPSQPGDPSTSDGGGFFRHHHHEGYSFGNGGDAPQQPSTGTSVSRR